MVILDVIFSLFVVIIGANFKNLFSNLTYRDKNILNKLYWYHLLISLVFSLYISNFGGDAQIYWQRAKVLGFDEIFGLVLSGSPSGTMIFFNYFPSKVLGLSLFTGNLMYSQLGFLGFILLYKLSKEYIGNNTSYSKFKILGVSVFPWIWFMPNLHFWSSGVGKDTLLFFSIAAFIYAAKNIRKRLLWVFISLLISVPLRPHITFFLLASFSFGYIFDGKLKGYQKAFVILLVLVGSIPILNYVIAFANLESIETASIEEYASNKSSSLNSSRSGSGVDTSNYPFVYKIFTFLYRPLFFDINNAFAVVASFENLILLIFTFKLLKKKTIKAIVKSDYLIKSCFVFFIIGSIAFSLILGNLGIMLRQKNMFIPWLILFGFWVFHYSHQTHKTKDI